MEQNMKQIVGANDQYVKKNPGLMSMIQRMARKWECALPRQSPSKWFWLIHNSEINTHLFNQDTFNLINKIFINENVNNFLSEQN